jgi:hypothetical protein
MAPPLDVKSLKEQALAATARFFADTMSVAPAEDSEEWEAEYRRQFDRLKAAPAPSAAAAAAQIPLVDDRPDALPQLSGTPADKRWAGALRTARLQQIPKADLRTWLGHSWIKAKDWIDTRELTDQVFLHRVAAQHDAERRRAASEAGAQQAARSGQEAEAAALRQRAVAAGLSAAGLIELIDLCARESPAALKEKLAELHVEGRTVRVFECANPALLMVLEKREDGRAEYGIERDQGLVADLKLFAQSGL